MAEPNHELTDSEAQAFQPEPHLEHLFKRLQPGSRVVPASPSVPADRPDPASETRAEDEGPSPARPSRRDSQ
jgi:hypothetical protein